MLDLLLFFWPVATLEKPALEPVPNPPRPARRRAPTSRAADKPQGPRGKSKRPQRRPAPRVLEGGRAGMP